MNVKKIFLSALCIGFSALVVGCVLFYKKKYLRHEVFSEVVNVPIFESNECEVYKNVIQKGKEGKLLRYALSGLCEKLSMDEYLKVFEKDLNEYKYKNVKELYINYYKLEHFSSVNSDVITIVKGKFRNNSVAVSAEENGFLLINILD